jgi:hypothetical protein
LTQLDIMQNPAGPDFTHLNSQALLAGMPESGVPTNGVATAYNEITGYIDNPFVPNVGDPTNNGLVNDQNFNELGNVNKSADDMDIHTKEVITGLTIQSGEFMHLIEQIDSESLQTFSVINPKEELQFSNVSNVCANTPAANAIIAQLVLKKLQRDKTIDKVIGVGYRRQYMVSLEECFNRTRPFGLLSFEVNINGGVSRVFKSGTGSGYSSYPTDEMPTILGKIVHNGDHQVLSGIVPANTRTGSRIFLVLLPTKVYNKTNYVTGGITANQTIVGEEKYLEFQSLAKNPNMTIDFGQQYNGSHFFYIPQWQIITTLDGGFCPEKLCRINWNLPENDALRKMGEPWAGCYSGFYQQIGILRNPMRFANRAPPTDADMVKASQDFNYRKETLGGDYDEGNQFTIVNTGTSGAFG